MDSSEVMVASEDEMGAHGNRDTEYRPAVVSKFSEVIVESKRPDDVIVAHDSFSNKATMVYIYKRILCSFATQPQIHTEANARTNHSCSLTKNNFEAIYIKNCTNTLAKQARVFDEDTDNRFIGEHLYVNIKERDRCYLMKRVTDIVVTNVLSEKKFSPEQHSIAQEVTTFFAFLNAQLSGCKPLGEKSHIESNLKQMKDKLDKLGEKGKNKAVGELDLLFQYLEKACTKVPQTRSNSQRGSKKN